MSVPFPELIQNINEHILISKFWFAHPDHLFDSIKNGFSWVDYLNPIIKGSTLT